MTIWRGAAVVFLVGAVAGCAASMGYVTRYTWAPANGWAPDNARLQPTHTTCVQEVNRRDIGNLYGGGLAIQKDHYKKCMEGRGYVKTKTEELQGLTEWDRTIGAYRLRPGVICGAPDQTCVFSGKGK